MGVLLIWEPSHFMSLFLLNPPSPIYILKRSFFIEGSLSCGSCGSCSTSAPNYQLTINIYQHLSTVILRFKFHCHQTFSQGLRFPVTLQIGLNGENVCHRHLTELGVPELFGDMKHRETRYIYIYRFQWFGFVGTRLGLCY